MLLEAAEKDERTVVWFDGLQNWLTSGSHAARCSGVPVSWGLPVSAFGKIDCARAAETGTMS